MYLQLICGMTTYVRNETLILDSLICIKYILTRWCGLESLILHIVISLTGMQQAVGGPILEVSWVSLSF